MYTKNRYTFIKFGSHTSHTHIKRYLIFQKTELFTKLNGAEPQLIKCISSKSEQILKNLGTIM